MKPHPNYQLVFADEFSGECLNEKQWRYRLGERFDGLNCKKNVQVQQGRLCVRFEREMVAGEERYTSGGIISRKLFGYGYYEAKGRLWGGSGGLHSSFWIMGTTGDGATSPKHNSIIEIDGYEVNSGRPSRIGMNVHYLIGTHKTVGGVEGTLDYQTIDTSAQEFVFGIEWLPNQLCWYLNGKLIRQLKNPVVYGPQNVWLTALGSSYFDQNIDLSCLPGESYWTYFRYYTVGLPQVNLIANPSFEYNKNKNFAPGRIRSLDVPVGWCKEGRDLEASSVWQTNSAFSGECVLRHFRQEPYQVTTKVGIPFPGKGVYTASAMVRNPHGAGHMLRVSGHGGPDLERTIPATDGAVWQKVELTGINVDTDYCQLSFSSECKGGEWLEVDAVYFGLQSGAKAHTDLAPFPEKKSKAHLPLGEVLVDYDLPGSGYKEFGNWNASGVSGFVHGSRYAHPRPENYASWQPQIAPGKYQVSFFNPAHKSRAQKARVQLFYSGGQVEKRIDQRQEPGWVDLGTFFLQQGDYVKLSAVSGSKGGLSADTVCFEPLLAVALRRLVERTWIFCAGSNQALLTGAFQRYSAVDPQVQAERKEGEICVPVAFAAVGFGAVHVEEELDAVEIFHKDYMIRFRVGKEVMEVKGEERPLARPMFRSRRTLFLPVSDLAQAFDLKSKELGSGLILVGPPELYQDFHLQPVQVESIGKLFI